MDFYKDLNVAAQEIADQDDKDLGQEIHRSLAEDESYFKSIHVVFGVPHIDQQMVEIEKMTFAWEDGEPELIVPVVSDDGVRSNFRLSLFLVKETAGFFEEDARQQNIHDIGLILDQPLIEERLQETYPLAFAIWQNAVGKDALTFEHDSILNEKIKKFKENHPTFEPRHHAPASRAVTNHYTPVVRYGEIPFLTLKI